MTRIGVQRQCLYIGRSEYLVRNWDAVAVIDARTTPRRLPFGMIDRSGDRPGCNYVAPSISFAAVMTTREQLIHPVVSQIGWEVARYAGESAHDDDWN